ncbi:MAG: hypothetical protein ABWK01_01835 [Infirmifilum sp.]
MHSETLETITPIVFPVLIASFFTFVPIENFLSAYPVPLSFTWYAPWRGALVALILWLGSGALYSDKYYWIKLFFLGSAAGFVFFHYWHLYIVSRFAFVRLYPVVYFVGNSPPIADLGQIVVALTLIAFRRELTSSPARAKKSKETTGR